MSDAILSQFTQEVDVEEKKSDKKLNVAIIGTGWIASAYTGPIKELGLNLVALADYIPGKAEKFAEKFDLMKFNPNFYPSHKELIDNEKDLDVVFICTYNTTHAECAKYALEHGVNVLLEKPFSVTLDEAVEVCKAEKKSGKLLAIGFQPRMDDNMQMIKKIVQSGELGDIYYIQTGGGRRLGIPGGTFIKKDTAGIGALGDIGCYSLDLVLNAIGYPKPLTASGFTSGFFGVNREYVSNEIADNFNVDDFGAGFIRLEGGIILDFRIAWAMNLDTPGDTIIMGTKGSLRVPSTECWNGSFDKPMTVYKRVAGEHIQYEVPLKKTPESLFLRKVRSFVEAVQNGTPSPIPSSEILYNQAIIDGICRSAELGKEIEIVIPEI